MAIVKRRHEQVFIGNTVPKFIFYLWHVGTPFIKWSIKMTGLQSFIGVAQCGLAVSMLLTVEVVENIFIKHSKL